MIQEPRIPPRIAFVLSGGAALGAAQAGMLRALLERNIIPDLIVGTSIGAWNGLWLSLHPNLADLDRLDRIWKGISLMELIGNNPMQLFSNVTTRHPYLVTDDGMKHIFRRAATIGAFPDMLQLETLPIPMKITATNLMRGTTKVFDRGLVQPALFASSAIPGLFPPVMIDGEQLCRWRSAR